MAKTTNQNTRVWDQVKITDPKHVKKLNSFLHTVDAMHNVERMTKLFGACGHGWGWTLLRDSNIELPNSNLVKEILLQLWWKDPKDGKIREVAPQAGVAQLMDAKSGRFDEYYYKKAITEAFSKSTSLLGMSADVYFGMFDNAAYVKWATSKFNKANDKEETNEDEVRSTPKDRQANADKEEVRAGAKRVVQGATKKHRGEDQQEQDG
jgi:hypothetical protein